VADGTVLDGVDVTVNESLLTGESEPIVKRAGDQVLSGSLVSTGTGHVVVTAVGRASYANKLTTEIRRYSLAHSELRAATNRILVYISWILAPIVLVVLASRAVAYSGALDVASLGPERLRDAITDVVASVVGMIPEGLVLLISLAFGVAAIRLAASKVLIQELAAVEVLARVDVLCLDKTGTLTSGDVSFHELVPIGNDSVGQAALSLFARDDAANATAKSLAEPFPDVGAIALRRIPFTSSRAFSGIEIEHRGARSSWLLGAPERLLGGFAEHAASATEFALTGQRVLALVRLGASLPESSDFAPADVSLEPAAILLFGEEIRPDAADTLAYFARQNVRCIILSGDNPRTVAALASGLGVGSGAIDASNLQGDDELRAALSTHSIFGRVAPEQKRAVVRVLQADGHTVAMTGDGVNDAMAIKEADLGIAMGSGTSASRAVARLVLLDNRFDRLPEVLAYGRRVIANVERVANLYLAKTVYGILFAIVFSVLLWEFPFLPRQLTLVSTLTIGVPSFVLALAPNKRIYVPGILRRLVRYAAATGVVAAFSVFLSFAIARDVVPLSEARTVATVTLFTVGFWILCVLTRPLNLPRGLLLATMLVLFVLAFTVPFGSEFFALDVSFGWPLLLGALIGLAGAGAIELVYRQARSASLIFDRE
jgi:cation-transporting ATPase E